MSIHTCSYYCDRPDCIRAQRDELRQKLEQAEDAVAAEREACAKLCESMDHDGVMIAADCAKAIRARGEK
jgi:hypothetical protein